MVCAMNSVYKFMDFIDYEQTAAWLKQLTNYSFSLDELVRIYREDKCRIFMDVAGIRGDPDFDDDPNVTAMAVGEGVREVIDFKPVGGDSFKKCKLIDIQFSGPYYSTFDLEVERLKNWSARIQKDSFEPYFLPADIEALATSINSHDKVEYKNNAMADTKSTSPVDAISGVSFPYSTEKLKALADAANKYWASYTPDKKKPTQKEISMYLLKLLDRQLTPNGEVPRDVAELPKVIEPESQKKR